MAIPLFVWEHDSDTRYIVEREIKNSADEMIGKHAKKIQIRANTSIMYHSKIAEKK